MNTLQNIYNKLAEDKTELAKHEVNLSLLNTLNDAAAFTQSAVDNANKLSYSLGEATTLWNKSFAKIKTEMINAEAGIIKAYKVISEINKQAKDLGIDKVPEADKIENYLRGYAKTLAALRGAVMDNKNRMDTNF